MIDLPKSCIVNKEIPKKIFYEKGISKQAKLVFTTVLEKIVWFYKISENTLNIVKSENIEEIHILILELKEKRFLKIIIREITKLIPYKLLFVIKYKEEFWYGMEEEEIYFSEWNKEINFDFSKKKLDEIYESMIKSILNEENNEENLETLLERKRKIDILKKKEKLTEKKMKSEPQFNRKVELNQELRKLTQELEELR